MAGHAYKSAVDELDAGVGRELVSVSAAISQATTHGSEQDAPFRATVLDPIGKLNSYYTNIDAAITKRSHKVALGCLGCL